VTGSERGETEETISESRDSLTSASASASASESDPDPEAGSDTHAVSTSAETNDNTEADTDETLLLRERQTPEGLLVAVCDSDCLGETYIDGEVSLNVTESFYGGTEADAVDAETVVRRLKRASVANIVGERAVAIAVEAGIVDQDRVLQVDETLHAQLVWM
jgi:hypothetical protein